MSVLFLLDTTSYKVGISVLRSRWRFWLWGIADTDTAVLTGGTSVISYCGYHDYDIKALSPRRRSMKCIQTTEENHGQRWAFLSRIYECSLCEQEGVCVYLYIQNALR